MNEDYPGDADGDALRRVAATGANMSRPMEIEFFVAIPDREAGEAIAPAGRQGGIPSRVGPRRGRRRVGLLLPKNDAPHL